VFVQTGAWVVPLSVVDFLGISSDVGLLLGDLGSGRWGSIGAATLSLVVFACCPWVIACIACLAVLRLAAARRKGGRGGHPKAE